LRGKRYCSGGDCYDHAESVKGHSYIMLVLLFIMSGYSESNPSISNSTNLESSSFTFEKATYNDQKIHVEFPRAVNAVGADIINSIIRQEALRFLEDFSNEERKLLEWNIVYTIEQNGPHVLSVGFWDYFYMQDWVHPYQNFHAVNIELNSYDKLLLTDLLTIDDTLYRTIKEYQLPESKKDDRTENVIQELKNPFTHDIWLGNLKNSSFYLRAETLGISLSVPHYMGEFINIDIPYKDLQPNLKSHEWWE